MNRTKIEWTDFTWNPITGCLNSCPYCYARKIAKRFPNIFPNGFKPTFHEDRLTEPYKLKKSSKIFTCSMGEIFGAWVPQEWVSKIFRVIIDCGPMSTVKGHPNHIFQILTKCPHNFSSFFAILNYRLPPNMWLGVTIDRQNAAYKKRFLTDGVLKGGVKFISFEPLLEEINIDLEGIDWIIIGAQTNPYKPPRKEWVQKLIDQARELDIPVFLKDNLRWHEKIQEFPGVRK